MQLILDYKGSKNYIDNPTFIPRKDDRVYAFGKYLNVKDILWHSVYDKITVILEN